MSVIVFFVIAIGVGVVAQMHMRGILFPSVLSGLVSSAIFHLVGFLLEGTLDSLVMISAIITSVLAFAIALGTGFAMRRSGKKRAEV